MRARERLERVGGDRCSLPLHLDRRGLDTVDAVDGRLDEHQAIAPGGDDLAALLPRIARDDEQNTVETERGACFGGDDDVRDVHGIERTAEHSEPFHTGSVRVCRLFTGPKHSRHLGPYHREVPTLHVLVRVWLPDRPGALGLVASRIGSVDGDIVGIDVLEQGDGVAVDEFAVELRDPAAIPILVREIEEVDGVSVEEVREVEHFPDPRLDALESAARLCSAPTVSALHETLVEEIRAEFLADWSALLTIGTVLASSGDQTPDPCVLEALDSGTAASPLVAGGTTGPDDLAVATLSNHGVTLLVGRDGHPFRRRERAQLLALAGIADRAWTMLEG